MDHRFIPVSVLFWLFGFSSLCASWCSPVALSQSTENIDTPQVAVDPSGNVTAVWIENDGYTWIVHSSSLPCGGSWQPTTDIISQQDQKCASPRIVVDANGNATVVWAENDSAIQASTKPFGGVWQETPDTITPAATPYVFYQSPQIAADAAGNATAVWKMFDGYNFAVQASTKPYGGSWAVPDTLSLGDQDIITPQIVVNT